MTAQSSVLDRLDRSLRGPRRARADMLAEVRDGLEDATDAYCAAGLPPAVARQRAEEEFGDAEVIAAELQTELTARYGLRSALLLAVVLGALTLLWDLIWQLAPATAWRNPGPLIPVLSSVVDTASLLTAGCGAVALVLLAVANRVPSTWAVRLLGWAVIAGVGVIAVASVAMHVTGVPQHPAYVPTVVAASGVSVVLGVWLVVRAVRCLHLAGPHREG
ncbi:MULTISPECIES: permease prefix domain 1-containing protein [Thermocrispum]|jgi:hypothetical protein|uniref:Permease prefix domain 1-containing protein n=1 Tax=Thermocrispum agreste TaxID=37925 RepID=A0A2W4JUW0_9PSEU|nr:MULTISPECIES: permease prefix domain 1-containing protein [Thermocrispum]PZN01496.1 MAG: hypothetical protein DIU77_00475 [Thermocrispum agreste]